MQRCVRLCECVLLHGTMGGERGRMIINSSRARIEEIYRKHDAAKRAERKSAEDRVKKIYQLKSAYEEKGKVVSAEKPFDQNKDTEKRSMNTVEETAQSLSVGAGDKDIKQEPSSIEKLGIVKHSENYTENKDTSITRDVDTTVPEKTSVDLETDLGQNEILSNLLMIANMASNILLNASSEDDSSQSTSVQRTSSGDSSESVLGDLLGFFDNDILKVISEFSVREYITLEEYTAIHPIPFDARVLSLLLSLRDYLGGSAAVYISTMLRFMNVFDFVTSGDLNEIVGMLSSLGK